MILSPAKTPLARLESAINRMVTCHRFARIESADDGRLQVGLVVLLLTDDLQRNLETLDACVILPEALKVCEDTALVRMVASPEASVQLLRRFAIARLPASLFLRDGELLGCLTGIRDWSDYRSEANRLVTASLEGERERVFPVRVTNHVTTGG